MGFFHFMWVSFHNTWGSCPIIWGSVPPQYRSKLRTRQGAGADTSLISIRSLIRSLITIWSLIRSLLPQHMALCRIILGWFFLFVFFQIQWDSFFPLCPLTVRNCAPAPRTEVDKWLFLIWPLILGRLSRRRPRIQNTVLMLRLTCAGYVHWNIDMNKCLCRYIYAHIFICTYICVYKYTCIYIYTHIYIYM